MRLNLLYGSAGMAASGFYPVFPSGVAPPPEERNETRGFKPAFSAPQRVRRHIRRAAIVGDSSAGGYGRGLETIFRNIDGVEVIAVADPREKGLRRVLEETGVPRGYTDYRTLLERENPELVCVAPRWSNQHHPMAKAALEAGAHVLVETPFTQTMAEADELMAIAARKNLKIAVATPMSCDPHVLAFQQKQENLIGEVQEMRVYGKMDERAGGEELVIRAAHLFDLVCLFAGDPNWVTARIWNHGKPAHLADIQTSRHGDIGPVIGDNIFAHFAMKKGANVTFLSRRSMREISGGWGIDFIGTYGQARLCAGFPPTFSLLHEPNLRPADRTDTWQRWPAADPYHEIVDGLQGQDAANRRMVKDWLDAIEGDREPLCSAARATQALEMVHGIFRAGLTGRRVGLPTYDRSHPLVGEL